MDDPAGRPGAALSETPVPLRKNRDFALLQSGQLLSNLGTQLTSLAYPLLVLAVTDSPAKAGVAGFARTIPYPLFGMLAGVAADRWNRKGLMIGADVVRALALGSLAATILLDATAFWAIAVVGFLEGCGAVVFAAAQTGAVRSVVPAPQVPGATAVQTARMSIVRLAGPPLGGALFGLGRAIPFVVDAVSYAFSTASLVAMRTPFQQQRERERTSVLAEIREGFGYLWRHSFLRTCALLFGIGDFVFPGLMLVLVVVGRRQGLTGGEIGALTAAFGAALLAGSLLSPLARRHLSVTAIIRIEMWTWMGCALFVVWPSVYVLAAAILPQALAIPSTDSVVHGYRIAMTPDRLIGRVDSAARNISLLFTPLGPLLAGLLLGTTSARATVAVFAALCLVLALWTTLSPAIRHAPSLDDLKQAPV